MSQIDTRINKLISEFVNNVTALARQAAMDTLSSAFSGRGASHVVDYAESAPAPARASNSGGGRRSKGAKRTAGDLGKLQDRLIEFVTSNPGLRIEQINKSLGTSTKDLALPIRKLMADGVFKSEGRKRSTKYFAGTGQRKAAAKRGRPRKRS